MALRLRTNQLDQQLSSLFLRIEVQQWWWWPILRRWLLAWVLQCWCLERTFIGYHIKLALVLVISFLQVERTVSLSVHLQHWLVVHIHVVWLLYLICLQVGLGICLVVQTEPRLFRLYTLLLQMALDHWKWWWGVVIRVQRFACHYDSLRLLKLGLQNTKRFFLLSGYLG